MKVNSRQDISGDESTTEQVVDWFANVARTDLENSPGQQDRPLDQVPGGAGDKNLRGFPRLAILGALVIAAGLIAWFTVLAPSDAGSDGSASGPETGTRSDAFGSFASPYPFGLDVTLSYNDLDRGERLEWRVQVLEVVEEQTASSQASTGDIAITSARIRLTYQDGPASGPATDIRFNAIGGDGAVYPAKIDACGEPAGRLTRGDFVPGDSVEGWVCWPVPTEDVPPSVMAVVATPADGVLYMDLKTAEEGDS